jgi:hypothetical protein
VVIYIWEINKDKAARDARKKWYQLFSCWLADHAGGEGSEEQ